jgi:hypothetical protein
VRPPPMRISRPSSSTNVEAAADRVLHLWSMITLPSDDELAVLRDTLMEELSKQHQLGERDLVIAGLKYLHQRIGLKK